MTGFKDSGRDWANYFERIVAESASGRYRVRRVGATQAIADATMKFRIDNLAGNPCFFALASPSAAPNIIARGSEVAREIVARTSDEVASRICVPSFEGSKDGESWAVYEYHKPFSSHRVKWLLERERTRPHLLKWLGQLVAETRRPLEDAADIRLQVERLEGLWEIQLPERMEFHARRAVDALKSGGMTFYSTAAHNDLWKNNILLQRSAILHPSSFMVIDWSGAAASNAFPILDLIRLCAAFRASKSHLRRELVRYAAILECEPQQLPIYVCMALSILYENREQFPIEQFCYQGRTVVESLEGALEGL